MIKFFAFCFLAFGSFAQASLNELPAELLRTIVYKLPNPSDVQSMKKSSRYLNDFVSSLQDQIKNKIQADGMFALSPFDLRLAKASGILIPVQVDDLSALTTSQLRDFYFGILDRIDRSEVDGVSTSNFYYFPALTIERLKGVINMGVCSIPECIGQLTAYVGLHVHSPGIPMKVNDRSIIPHLPKGYKGHSIPQSIGQMIHLTTFELRHGCITHLPDSFSRLTNLMYLSLTHNMLVSVPDWIGNFRRLKSLDLRSNNIKIIPASIGSLINLKYLVLSDNPIESDLTVLTPLTKLLLLSFNGIGLREFPSFIKGFVDLTSLELANNPLMALPDWLEKMPNLGMIVVNHNQYKQASDTLKLKLLPLCSQK